MNGWEEGVISRGNFLTSKFIFFPFYKTATLLYLPVDSLTHSSWYYMAKVCTQKSAYKEQDCRFAIAKLSCACPSLHNNKYHFAFTKKAKGNTEEV